MQAPSTEQNPHKFVSRFINKYLKRYFQLFTIDFFNFLKNLHLIILINVLTALMITQRSIMSAQSLERDIITRNKHLKQTFDFLTSTTALQVIIFYSIKNL